MDEETYKQLLAENEKLTGRIEELEKKVTDVCAFNKALLSRTDNPVDNAKQKRQEELEKKLGRCLGYGE